MARAGGGVGGGYFRQVGKVPEEVTSDLISEG